MHVDIGCEESVRDPAGYFARAREHGGDVQWSEAQRGWVVLSHEGVEAGFRDTTMLSADRMGSFARVAEGRSRAFAKAIEMLHGWMNFRDPPAHTHLRTPVAAAFSPRAMRKLEADVEQIVATAIDRFDGDTVDLSAAFARPVPALVIAAILGVEGEERERFQEWSDDMGRLVFSLNPGAVNEGPVAAAAGEFMEFFSRHIERERREPSGSLLTTIVHSDIGELSHIELIGACTVLLFGGHETTTTLLINSIATLLERPDLQEWLRRRPEATETAVEEFMRVGGPARSMPRKVAVAHERGGQQLAPGQNVYLCIAAANHDAAVFEDPGTIDLQRDPNPQLGFGWGLHYCLGATLGRMEAGIALRTLLERFSNLEPAAPIPPAHGSAMGFGRRPLVARTQIEGLRT